MARSDEHIRELARRIDAPRHDAIRALRVAERELPPNVTAKELVRNARRVLDGLTVEDVPSRHIPLDREDDLNARRF